jgi:hypothetical protein
MSSIKEMQWMLDFTAEHAVTADVEVNMAMNTSRYPQKKATSRECLAKGDVRTRPVIYVSNNFSSMASTRDGDLLGLHVVSWNPVTVAPAMPSSVSAPDV